MRTLRTSTIQEGCRLSYTQYGPIMNGGVRACGDAAIRYRTISCRLLLKFIIKLRELYYR